MYNNSVEAVRGVAPYAGAWIEIGADGSVVLEQEYVAPYAGAWIEITYVDHLILLFFVSLPTRERGLKYGQAHFRSGFHRSLPTRERGLKCITN